ncbi:MAG: NINE protein [Candidatus Sumerlaea chitinivorans]|nr:NINE protein [Candidatus Sumerlaea chitinivorans]
MPHRSSSSGTNIGELLLREGLITNAQLDIALARQKETDLPLMRVLIESGFIDETRRLNFLKRHFGIPLISLESVKLDPILYTYIPAHIARRHHLVPVKLDRDGLVVAMEDPSDLVVIDNLKELVGLRIKPVVAPSAEIQEALAGYPEEEAPKPLEKPEKFDAAVRFFGWFFLPIMSIAFLAAIFGLLWWNTDFQKWLQAQFSDNVTRSSQVFTLFLYFFLTWGVWTIIMYEVRGIVFDDLSWKEADDLGPLRKKGKARLFALFLGWLGVDRFYLGYKGMGILKLFSVVAAIATGLLAWFGYPLALTFAVPFAVLTVLWWLLDFFLLLGGNVPDAAGRPLE